MSIRWSEWLPWLRRRHPLGWPKPKPRITVWPERLQEQERQRRKAITDAMIAALGQPQRESERPGLPPHLFTQPEYLFLVPHQGKPDAESARPTFLCDCPPFRHTEACYDAWRAAGRPPFRRRTEGER